MAAAGGGTVSDLDLAVLWRYQERIREREAELECAAWEACGGVNVSSLRRMTVTELTCFVADLFGLERVLDPAERHAAAWSEGRG